MAAQNPPPLRKFVAPEFVYGKGARLMAGRYAFNFGARRVMVVSDAGVIAAGWTEQVAQSLAEAGLDCFVFDRVTPNPRAEQVMEGAEAYRAQACDVIVAVGGGSPMDCAKGIGIVAANGGRILEYQGVDEVHNPLPPLICIPTTAGTSADVSQFAIITHLEERTKVAIISKAVVPDIALIDPICTTSMPPFLTACTGMDALVHGVEAYVSNAHSLITDLHALEAVSLVTSYLPQVVHAPEDIHLRSQVMVGSLQAGLAFSNASLGAVHAMAHSLGGFLDLPHGQCCALLLPHVIDFNYSHAPECFDRIGDVMGLRLSGLPLSQRKPALIEAILHLLEAVGICQTLSQLGVRISDIPILAEKAMVDPCMVTNPRRPERRDIEVIYEHAL